MAKTVDDFIKGGYEQIEWPENGVIKVQYLGQEIVETRWGDRVKLAIFDLVNLKETALYTTSAKLLRKLFRELKVQINDKIAIKREGSGFETKYDAKIISRVEPETAAAEPTPETSTLISKKAAPAEDEPF